MIAPLRTKNIGLNQTKHFAAKANDEVVQSEGHARLRDFGLNSRRDRSALGKIAEQLCWQRRISQLHFVSCQSCLLHF